MNKKFFNVVAALLVVTFFSVAVFTGCDAEKLAKQHHDPDVLSTTDLDLDAIRSFPYSELTPEEQKVKLELESIELLNQLESASSLAAIEVFEYLIELLEIDEPQVEEPIKESRAGLWEVLTFDASYAYGVFTWNDASQSWRRANSSSELKFVFPSGEGKSNNASFTVNSRNSNSNIVIEDSSTGGESNYHDRTVINLPGTITGILSLDNKEIARVEFGAEYEKFDKVEISGPSEDEYEDDDEEEYDDENWLLTVQGSYPVVVKLRISTNEGFVYWYNIDGKGKESSVEMQLSKDNKVLIESLFAFDIDFKSLLDEVSDDIDELFDLDIDVKANGYTKLLDDLVLIYAIDAMNLASEMERLDDEYDDENQAYCNDLAEVLNTNMSVVLVSLKEGDNGFKIADIVYNVETDDGDYYVSPFLKFGDGTQIEMDAYFGSGFSDLTDRWDEFREAFGGGE